VVYEPDKQTVEEYFRADLLSLPEEKMFILANMIKTGEFCNDSGPHLCTIGHFATEMSHRGGTLCYLTEDASLKGHPCSGHSVYTRAISTQLAREMYKDMNKTYIHMRRHCSHSIQYHRDRALGLEPSFDECSLWLSSEVGQKLLQEIRRRNPTSVQYLDVLENQLKLKGAVPSRKIHVPTSREHPLCTPPPKKAKAPKQRTHPRPRFDKGQDDAPKATEAEEGHGPNVEPEPENTPMSEGEKYMDENTENPQEREENQGNGFVLLYLS
jgi:hypothetical protein